MQEQQASQGRRVTPRGEGLSRLPLWGRHRARQRAGVEAALAELVAMGLVLEEKGEDGQTRYGVDPEKVSGIWVQIKEPLRRGRGHRLFARRMHRR